MITEQDIDEVKRKVKNINTDDEVDEIEELLERFDDEIDNRFDGHKDPDENGMVHDEKKILINPRESGQRKIEFPDEDRSDVVIDDNDTLEINHKLSVHIGLKKKKREYKGPIRRLLER